MTLPTLYFQLTRLPGTMMLWISTASSPLQARLTESWACAMPPTVRHLILSCRKQLLNKVQTHLPVASTSLFRSPQDDISAALAGRLGKHYDPSKIHSLKVNSPEVQDADSSFNRSSLECQFTGQCQRIAQTPRDELVDLAEEYTGCSTSDQRNGASEG